MAQREDDRLGRWLEAERAGRADEAEAIFSALFAEQLPVLDPLPGFAERVAGAAVSARAARPWAWRSVRLLAVNAVVVMGLVLWAVLAVDPFAVVRASAAGLAGLLADARAVLHAGIAAWLTAWTLAASIGRAMLFASASGLVPFVLVANLLLALASSYGLAKVMAPREECP